MKRAALVVVCLSALIVACSGSTEVGEVDEAGQTVKQFYKHLNAGDHDAAFDLYSSDVRQMLQGDDGKPDEDFLTWAQTESREGAIDQVKILGEEIDEGAGAATVRFELDYSSGAPGRRIVILSKEDDNWKLGFIDEDEGKAAK